MEFLNRPRQTLHLIHTRRAVSGIIRTNQITWDIHHFVQNGWFWPILASLRGFFLDALWRNYLNLVHFSFSRSGSIPLVFGVTNMVVSPRQTCFFISYDLKRYWKNCTGLTYVAQQAQNGLAHKRRRLEGLNRGFDRANRCRFPFCFHRTRWPTYIVYT